MPAHACRVDGARLRGRHDRAVAHDPPQAAHPADDGEGRQAPYTTSEFFEWLQDGLGAGFTRIDDANFAWLTPFPADQHERLARQAHYALHRLPELIPGLDPRPPAGGWPAVVFAGIDQQLAYRALMHAAWAGVAPDAATSPATAEAAAADPAHVPDPAEPASIIDGGSWSSYPVGHLAIPWSDREAPDAAFAHELVHAVLDTEGVPVWLQEGIATEVETHRLRKPGATCGRHDAGFPQPHSLHGGQSPPSPPEPAARRSTTCTSGAAPPPTGASTTRPPSGPAPPSATPSHPRMPTSLPRSSASAGATTRIAWPPRAPSEVRGGLIRTRCCGGLSGWIGRDCWGRCGGWRGGRWGGWSGGSGGWWMGWGESLHPAGSSMNRAEGRT